jgi:hypothetical protein
VAAFLTKNGSKYNILADAINQESKDKPLANKERVFSLEMNS